MNKLLEQYLVYLNESTTNKLLNTFANAKTLAHANRIRNMFIKTANNQVKKITSIISKNTNKDEAAKLLKNLNLKHKRAIQGIEMNYQKAIKRLK